jgi:serine/threonine-protein kinase
MHPPAEALLQFTNGLIDGAAADAIAAHLDECGECVSKLESLPNVDPLTQLLQVCSSRESEDQGDLRGRTIGPYALLEELGRGGMGVVYRAFDQRLKREVAIKLILGGVHADGERRARMRLEAEAIAALSHPGIVQVFDVGEADGLLYFVLELLDPGGLYSATGKQKQSPRWCAALVRQVAEALEHAHAAGIVHRDLKPENLLLAADQAGDRPGVSIAASEERQPPPIKITDFGLCAPTDEALQLTHSMMMLGTPEYMAPEQLPDCDSPVGKEADIFALGAILYELLLGRPPFREKTLAQQLRLLRACELPDFPRSDTRLPRELEAICRQCLAKDPAKRYSSAQALADDLGRFLAGEPVQARLQTPWLRLLAWGRRKPLLAAHLILAASLYILNLVDWLVLHNPHHSGPVQLRMTLVMFGWATLATLFEVLRSQTRYRRLGDYLFAALPLCLMFLPFWVGVDLNPAFPSLFIMLIPVLVLIRPSLAMLAFATTASAVSFNAFMAIKGLGSEPFLTINYLLFFNVVLMLAGVVTWLLIRRLPTRD